MHGTAHEVMTDNALQLFQGKFKTLRKIGYFSTLKQALITLSLMARWRAWLRQQKSLIWKAIHSGADAWLSVQFWKNETDRPS